MKRCLMPVCLAVLAVSAALAQQKKALPPAPTCGADSDDMQYQCFPHAERTAANSCTAQALWQQ